MSANPAQPHPLPGLRSCPTCRQPNPGHANYCRRCGRKLTLEEHPFGGCGRRTRSACCGDTPSGSLVAMVFVGLGLVLAMPHLADKGKAPTRLVPRVERSYELPAHKAEAMFRLLAPPDVPVLVSRDKKGIRIRGTEAEAAAMDEFVSLVRRVERLRPGDIRRFMDSARRHWTTSRIYRLSEHKAEQLWRLLAFEDVPVLVSRRGSAVGVDAAPEDQQIIRRMVAILGGQ